MNIQFPLKQRKSTKKINKENQQRKSTKKINKENQQITIILGTTSANK